MTSASDQIETREGAPVSSARRAAQGTLTLAAVGAFVGGSIGTIMLAAFQVNAPGGLSWVDVPFSLMFGGGFGAAAGAVGAPIVGWALLRHVTVGRAILWTGIGTLAGALATRYTGGYLTLNSCIGFICGAILCRVSSRRAS